MSSSPRDVLDLITYKDDAMTLSRNNLSFLYYGLLMLLLLAYQQAHAGEITGGWVKKQQNIRGEWTIEAREDGHYLVLGDDFRTRRAPDLKFVLSNQSVDTVSSDTAMEDALFVAQLQSARGAQEYKLPDNFSDYSTLLLHCEQYTKLWGAASLK